MKKEKFNRKQKEQFGLKRFFKSFVYSFEGLKYAFHYEQNIIVHFLVTVLVLFLGYFLKLSIEEWLVVILAIASVIASELINTSIEAAVDLTTTEVSPLAKASKDTAAAGVLVFAFSAFVVGLLIFLPKIIALF